MNNNADDTAKLDARLNAALRRRPNAPVPSNFTARVLDAIDLDETKSARQPGWTWNWRLLFPRMAVTAAVLIFAGVSIQRYEANFHRVELAKNLALVASAQSPGVDALENLDAIQSMSQSAHADGELLAALQ
jgi:negative regulator of sigma E activity